MPQKTRFTIYDKMENDGVFSSNPANAGASDVDGNMLYTGPIPYPKMMYHPEGEEQVTTPAEIVTTPLGPTRNNEQRQMIHRLVNSREEEDEALAEGWHDHPAKAIAARVEKQIEDGDLDDKAAAALRATVPKLPVTQSRIAEMEAEIARLKASKSATTAKPAA